MCDLVTKWSKDTWSSLGESPCGMGSHLIACNKKSKVGKPHSNQLLQVLTIQSWALGAYHVMPTHTLRIMKTCKPSFAPLDVCIQKGWKWHSWIAMELHILGMGVQQNNQNMRN